MKKLTLITVLICLSTLNIALAQIQNALSFDNTDDYVEVPNASALIAGGTSLSISCWVYPANTNISFPDYDGFCGFRNNTNADFYLIQHEANAVEARFRNSGGVNTDIVINNLQINTWQHFVFTYDGDRIKLYLNGVLAGTQNASGSINDNTVPFLIGSLDYLTYQFLMNGRIDEVSLWNKSLSPDEIQHIYECSIDPSSTNLLLYYKFDQGIPNGNNTSITSLIPTVGALNGILHNFALTGSTSNFVEGITTPVYQYVATICNGDTYQFGDLVLTAPGVYTQTFPTATGCDSIVELTLLVFTVNNAVSLSGATLTAQQGGAMYQWVFCDSAFTPVTGATGQSFSPTVNGTYAVIVNLNNCSVLSQCVTVNTVGMPERNNEEEVSIYPNPVQGQLNVVLDKIYSEVRVEILTSLGQRISEVTFYQQQQIKLDVSDFPEGAYWMRIMPDDKLFSKLFIK